MAEQPSLSGPMPRNPPPVSRAIQTVDMVLRKSKSESMVSVLYFYSHMPERIAGYFPKPRVATYYQDTGYYMLAVEACPGLTLSSLLLGHCIQPWHLRNLLGALHDIHSSKGTTEVTIPILSSLDKKFEQHSLQASAQQLDIYQSYSTKFSALFSQNRHHYANLGPQAEALFGRLYRILIMYEDRRMGLPADVIHGNPVLFNVHMTHGNHGVVIAAAEGHVEGSLTAPRDANWDLAKVLLSLCGYDLLIYEAAKAAVGARVDDIDTWADPSLPLWDDSIESLMAGVRDIFFSLLAENYAVPIYKETLFCLTASMFFSAIPLQDPKLGPVFLRLCTYCLSRTANLG